MGRTGEETGRAGGEGNDRRGSGGKDGRGGLSLSCLAASLSVMPDGLSLCHARRLLSGIQCLFSFPVKMDSR